MYLCIIDVVGLGCYPPSWDMRSSLCIVRFSRSYVYGVYVGWKTCSLFIYDAWWFVFRFNHLAVMIRTSMLIFVLWYIKHSARAFMSLMAVWWLWDDPMWVWYFIYLEGCVFDRLKNERGVVVGSGRPMKLYSWLGYEDGLSASIYKSDNVAYSDSLSL